MSCQKHPYLHSDGLVYADADSCHWCSLRRSADCDGWRKEKKRTKRAASMKPKRRTTEETR